MRAYLYVFQNKWTSTVYIFIAISLLVRSGCYGLNVCAFLPLPPQFMCWSPNFQCGLWEWKLWEVIGWSHGSRSLMMDWCPYKGTNRPELSLGHVGIQQEGRCLQAREQVLTRTQSWWHSDIGLLVSRTVRYIQLFKPPSWVFYYCSSGRLRQWGSYLFFQYFLSYHLFQQMKSYTVFTVRSYTIFMDKERCGEL